MELIVLGVVAGVSFLSYTLWRRSRTDTLGQALLEERNEASLRSAEPTIHGLRPGDVVTHLTTDYVVEHVLAFDEDGRTTRLYRLADGARVRFLGARPDSDEPLLLDEVRELDVPVERGAPDQLVHGGRPYRLASRASTKVTSTGTGPRPPGDRAMLYEYAGVGARRLMAIVWDRETTALEGESVSTGVLEILPGG